VSVRVIDAREEVGEVVCELAESPIWDDRFDLLRWVDLDRGQIHGHSAGGGQLPPIDVGQNVGFILPSGEDRLLAGLRDGFATVGLEGQVELEVELEVERPQMRMNDGRADAAGRVWAGTMGIRNPQPEGALYRLDRDWTVTPELVDLTIPNGLGWSPDASTMYFTDSTWGRIDAFEYDLDTGSTGGRRACVEIPAEAGMPDGFTVDAEGCIWVALWCGSAVHRYTPEGRLDTVVRVPALQTTSCVFGGPDLRELYITSARLDMTEQQLADHPRSGRVFVCQPGVEGRPTQPFVAGE
jgi:sugar lactone lactonase YvrE